MKKFKIRCSAIGKIMPNGKGDFLSKTTQGYCQDWVKEQVFGKRKDFSSKYTDKGNEVEDASLDYIAEHLDYGLLIKNEDYFENDFLTGTPDVVLKDHLIDVKNSWDCFTFPMFYNGIPNKDYYWQAQGYMELTGLKKYKLIYVLMDTPGHLIEREYRFNNDGKTYEEFEKKYLYSNVESKYRIKIFDIDYNEEDVKKIKERVRECQDYINTIKF